MSVLIGSVWAWRAVQVKYQARLKAFFNILKGAGKQSPITEIQASNNCLPVIFRTDFKFLLITYKAVRVPTPSYFITVCLFFVVVSFFCIFNASLFIVKLSKIYYYYFIRHTHIQLHSSTSHGVSSELSSDMDGALGGHCSLTLGSGVYYPEILSMGFKHFAATCHLW